MWMGAHQLLQKDPALYDNLMAFAHRHHIIPYESGANDVTSLKRFLNRAKEEGIHKTWIEIGPGREEATIKDFVEDAEARKPTLDRFRKLAQTYKSIYPNFARITIFDEAPLGAFNDKAVTDSAGYMGAFRQFKKYTPKAYSYLFKAIKDVFPATQVGVFLHHPHNASAKMSGKYSYIAEFMRKTDSLGATPDFIYSDLYRGYFNRGYGVEATDKYITDVVQHTHEVARRYGANAYQLGEVHTIKLGYTPSRLQIDSNVDAMLAGHPDGIGWYWPNYAATNKVKSRDNPSGKHTNVDVSFNPFVPNSWGKIGAAGSIYGTSRDRFTYAYLRILEAEKRLQPDQLFDLWLYGYDFDHTEHTLWLKDAKSGSWKFIGHFNPQQDPSGYEQKANPKNIYSYNNKWHAVVFHGLSRKRFFDGDDPGLNGDIQFKITTTDSSDGSELSAIYAVPYRQTRNYITEDKVTHFIETQPRWMAINSLASHVRPIPFKLTKGSQMIGKLVPPASDTLQSQQLEN